MLGNGGEVCRTMHVLDVLASQITDLYRYYISCCYYIDYDYKHDIFICFMLRSSEAFWCNAAAEAFADHGDWISYRWARSIVLVGGLPRVFVCVWQLPDPARHFQVPHSCQMYVCVRSQDGWRRKSAMDPSMLTGARRHGEILQKLCKLCHGLSYCTWIRFFASWMHAHTHTHRQSAHTMTHYAHARLALVSGWRSAARLGCWAETLPGW